MPPEGKKTTVRNRRVGGKEPSGSEEKEKPSGYEENEKSSTAEKEEISSVVEKKEKSSVVEKEDKSSLAEVKAKPASGKKRKAHRYVYHRKLYIWQSTEVCSMAETSEVTRDSVTLVAINDEGKFDPSNSPKVLTFPRNKRPKELVVGMPPMDKLCGNTQKYQVKILAEVKLDFWAAGDVLYCRRSDVTYSLCMVDRDSAEVKVTYVSEDLEFDSESRCFTRAEARTFLSKEAPSGAVLCENSERYLEKKGINIPSLETIGSMENIESAAQAGMMSSMLGMISGVEYEFETADGLTDMSTPSTDFAQQGANLLLGLEQEALLGTAEKTGKHQTKVNAGASSSSDSSDSGTDSESSNSPRDDEEDSSDGEEPSEEKLNKRHSTVSEGARVNICFIWCCVFVAMAALFAPIDGLFKPGGTNLKSTLALQDMQGGQRQNQESQKSTSTDGGQTHQIDEDLLYDESFDEHLQGQGGDKEMNTAKIPMRPLSGTGGTRERTGLLSNGKRSPQSRIRTTLISRLGDLMSWRFFLAGVALLAISLFVIFFREKVCAGPVAFEVLFILALSVMFASGLLVAVTHMDFEKDQALPLGGLTGSYEVLGVSLRRSSVLNLALMSFLFSAGFLVALYISFYRTDSEPGTDRPTFSMKYAWTIVLVMTLFVLMSTFGAYFWFDSGSTLWKPLLALSYGCVAFIVFVGIFTVVIFSSLARERIDETPMPDSCVDVMGARTWSDIFQFLTGKNPAYQRAKPEIQDESELAEEMANWKDNEARLLADWEKKENARFGTATEAWKAEEEAKLADWQEKEDARLEAAMEAWETNQEQRKEWQKRERWRINALMSMWNRKEEEKLAEWQEDRDALVAATITDLEHTMDQLHSRRSRLTRDPSVFRGRLPPRDNQTVTAGTRVGPVSSQDLINGTVQANNVTIPGQSDAVDPLAI